MQGLHLGQLCPDATSIAVKDGGAAEKQLDETDIRARRGWNT
jgi:hypothetical protein